MWLRMGNIYLPFTCLHLKLHSVAVCQFFNFHSRLINMPLNPLSLTTTVINAMNNIKRIAKFKSFLWD